MIIWQDAGHSHGSQHSQETHPVQPPDGSGTPPPAPDPAHTPAPGPAAARFRPAYWIGTALALAALLAGAAVIQPSGAATASSTAPADGKHRAGPDPREAFFPLGCGGERPDILGRRSADLDHDGRPETVAVVRCHAGMGTPPSGVYVLGEPAVAGAPPPVLETLLDPRQDMSVHKLTVTGSEISATLLGYSSDKVPRCCPDQRALVEWTWRDGEFVKHVRPGPGTTRSV